MTEHLCAERDSSPHLIRLFREIGHKLKRLGDRQLEERGVTFSQLRILIFLLHREAGETALQKDVETFFGIRRSSVTAILQNMEKADLIRREAVADDARKKGIVVTEKGRELAESLRGGMETFERELAETFSPEERDELVGFLSRVIEKLTAMEKEQV